MRILMVVRPAAGGMKEHVVALSAGLIARGHEVEAAAPPGSDVADALARAGVTVHGVGIVGPLHPVADPRAIAAVRRLVRAGGFDVVHAHGFKAGLVGRLGARLGGGVPVVVTAHNHVLLRDETPAGAKTRYRAVERSLSGLVARYIAVSASIASELTDAYGLPADKVVVVRNGVDPAPFLAPQDRAAARRALGLPAGAVVIGLAARFSSQKGLRHLVAAAPLVRDALLAQGRELAVVIGGSGPLESELREAVAAIGLGATVRWPGHIDAMPAFLAALDIYVSPAETEALGLGLIEAALASVPTVATDVGGACEVVVDGVTGVLVAPRDPAALAEAVLGIVRAPGFGATLAQAARDRCLVEFAPERMLDGTLAVYEGVIA